eukprot:3035391-Prymnesium_polylepis.1
MARVPAASRSPAPTAHSSDMAHMLDPRRLDRAPASANSGRAGTRDRGTRGAARFGSSTDAASLWHLPGVSCARTVAVHVCAPVRGPAATAQAQQSAEVHRLSQVSHSSKQFGMLQVNEFEVAS